MEHLRKNTPELLEMDPVAEITGEELPKEGRATERALAFLRSIGNKVSREGFGDVLFSRSKVKSAMIGHGVSNAKVETIAAVPAVIQNGRQIDYIENYEGRGYDTYLFAGPATYKGKPILIGVVVDKDRLTGRYYVHEAVDSDGNILIENEEPKTAVDRSPDRDRPVAVSDSGTTIPQPASPVKGGGYTFEAVRTEDGYAVRVTNTETGETESVIPGFRTAAEAEEAARASRNEAQNITTQNGGNENGRTEGAEPADASAGAGGVVSDGDGGRVSDGRAGVKAGGVERGAGAKKSVRGAEQAAKAFGRQNSARAVQTEKINLRDFGVKNAAEGAENAVMPESLYDDEIKDVDELIFRRTGQHATFVYGVLRIADRNGKVGNARGVRLADGRIVIQVDNLHATVTQIAKHEVFHEMAADDPGLRETARERVTETYSEEEFGAVAEKYAARLESICADEAAVIEEILADAYAGINAFAAGADAFTDAVRSVTEERSGYRGSQTAEATERTTGPPGRYSISDTLDDDLWNVMNGGFPKESSEIYIGETSNFLTDKIGAQALRVTMPENKAYAAMATEDQAIADGRYDENVNYHGLGIQGLHKVLEASENPVAAFVDTPVENGKRSDRIVLVTDEMVNGDRAVVIEQFDTSALLRGRRIKANKIISTYDRTQVAADIEAAAREGRLLHLDKKRSQALTAGVPGANSPAAIREADFKKNIQDFWAGVKWKKEGRSEYTAESRNAGEEDWRAKLKQFEAEAENDKQPSGRYSIEDKGADYITDVDYSIEDENADNSYAKNTGAAEAEPVFSPDGLPEGYEDIDEYTRDREEQRRKEKAESMRPKSRGDIRKKVGEAGEASP